MRIGSFIIVAYIALFWSPIMVALIAGVYALWWVSAYELIILAMAIDAYFGHTMPPIYTIGAIIVVAIAQWVKPRMLYYQDI